MGSSQQHPAVGLQEVRQAELESIIQRREQVQLPSDVLEAEKGKSTQMVGVALSGGGLRSACFGLGVLQAFFKTGFWRYVDYLSTVSGGGYIGSFLSSYVVHRGKRIGPNDCPILPRAESDLQHPPEVQRFIYGGRYLVRPWEIANKYLVGLFFINAMMISGLTAICAAVAFLWRTFDYESVRQNAGLLGMDGLSGDAVAPFWPFFVFVSAWLIAWIISYWRHGAEAPGKFARSLLFLVAASLLIGIAVLFGNGDADLSFLTTSSSVDPWRPGSTLWTTLAGLTLGGLIPFLTPKRLIQSGLRPKSVWERWVFAGASTAAMVGVPLLLVGFFAQEDISGFNSSPHRCMARGDLLRVGNMLELLWPDCKEAQKLRRVDDANAGGFSKLVSQGKLNQRANAVRLLRGRFFCLTLVPIEDTTDSHAPDSGLCLWINPVVPRVMQFREKWRSGLGLRDSGEPVTGKRSSVAPKILDELTLQVTISEKDRELLHPSEKAGRRFGLMVALQELDEVLRTKRDAYLGKDQYLRSGAYWHGRLHRMTEALQHYFWGDDPENDATELSYLTRKRTELEMELLAAFEHDVLGPCQQSQPPDLNLLRALLNLHTARSNDSENKAGASSREYSSSRSSSRDDSRAERRKAMIDAATHEGTDHWTSHEVYELKVLLLESEFQQVFRPRSDPQRRTSLAEDQRTRLAWLGTSHYCHFFSPVSLWTSMLPRCIGSIEAV